MIPPTRTELAYRPGRFDRVFAFPYPEQAERVRLIQRYSPWPVVGEAVAEIARRSDGLTGAHLREVCYAAALAAAERPAGYADALYRELVRVTAQHEQARSYDFELGRRKAGFGG